MRNKEISFINVILCLLVMWIHICSVAIGGLARDSAAFLCVYLPWRLSAFVVQGFIFLSALKIFRNMGNKPFRYGNFFIGRLKKIGLPYLMAVILSYLGLIYLGYYMFDWRFLVKSILLGNMIAPFYFITIIFQFYFLMPFWRWITENMAPWMYILFSLLLMTICQEGLPWLLKLVWPNLAFPYNDRIFTSYLVYWALGCYAGKNYDAFRSEIAKSGNVLTVVFLLAAMADGVLSYWNTIGKTRVVALEQIHTLYVCGAILFLYHLAEKVAERCMANRLCRGIDEMSYSFYLYHGILLYFVQDRLFLHLGIVGLDTGLLLRAVCCYGLAAVVALSADLWKRRRKA